MQPKQDRDVVLLNLICKQKKKDEGERDSTAAVTVQTQNIYIYTETNNTIFASGRQLYSNKKWSID